MMRSELMVSEDKRNGNVQASVRGGEALRVGDCHGVDERHQRTNMGNLLELRLVLPSEG